MSGKTSHTLSPAMDSTEQTEEEPELTIPSWRVKTLIRKKKLVQVFTLLEENTLKVAGNKIKIL